MFILARSANQKADLRMQVPCYNEGEGWRKTLKKFCPWARVRRRKLKIYLISHILQMKERRFLQQVQLIETLNKAPVNFPDNFILFSE